MQSIRKLILLFISVSAAPPALMQAQPVRTYVSVAPAVALEDEALIDQFLQGALILPKEKVSRVLIFDLLQDGFGVGDVAVLFPEQSIHMLDILPSSIVGLLQETQESSVRVDLEMGRAAIFSPLSAFAESFDQLVRHYYSGNTLAATILWRPDRSQVTVWGTALDQMQFRTWEEIASGGNIAYPVAFRKRGSKEVFLQVFSDGSECQQTINAAQGKVVLPCK